MLHHKQHEKPNTHVTAIGGEQFTERPNINSIPHISGGIRQDVWTKWVHPMKSTSKMTQCCKTPGKAAANYSPTVTSATVRNDDETRRC